MFRWQPAVCSVGLVATTLLTGLPQAQGVVEEPRTRVVLRDGTNDVWSISESEQPPELAGSAPTADVRRAVVAHRRGAVIVRLAFVDLKRVHTQQVGAFVSTPSRFMLGIVTADPGRRAGRHVLVDYNRGEVRCPGMSHDLDYTADRVSMRIPRSCLGRPRWVKVSVMNSVYKQVDGVFTELADNPHNLRSSGGDSARLFRGR